MADMILKSLSPIGELSPKPFTAGDKFVPIPGPQGEPGESAYQTAVDNGFKGTEKEWLASLQGQPGEKGPKGDIGPIGPAGQDGKDGKDGKDGNDGKDGAIGPAGPQGSPGIYLGTTEPTDVSVWLDPSGDADIVVSIEDVKALGYLTEEEVDEKINAIEIPEVDLTDYALKSEIPDVSKYQTEAQVIALIEEYGGGGEALPSAEEVEF